MRSTPRAALGGLLFLVLAGSLGALTPDVVGTLDAFDGTLTVVRAGSSLPPDKVDTGFAFENADQIRVSRDGWADIALDNRAGIRAHLHLSSSTVLSLDLSSLTKASQVGALDLLAGSLALKVEKLVGGNGLNVHTATAVAGVRGTEFAVDTEIDGSVLVTTTEGRVELCPDDGASHVSVPGTAVRGDGDEAASWSEVAVGDPRAFVEAWHRERFEVFSTHRDVILSALSHRYLNLTDRFAEAVRRLEVQHETFERWNRDEGAGVRGFDRADERLKARVLVTLMEARRLALALERVQRRLGLIEARLGPEAFGALPVPGVEGGWASFVRQWRAEAPALDRQLAGVQDRVRLFGLRSAGRLPRI